jgi:hypothetical protein
MPRHNLREMIVIVLCAILCGAESWRSIAKWGKDNEAWLKKYLKLAYGTASYETFYHVFQQLNARVFRACLREWVMSLMDVVVAIDGKTAQGSRDGPNTALRMIHGLCLAREGVREKGKEIEDIKTLLETLALKGCIVRDRPEDIGTGGGGGGRLPAGPAGGQGKSTLPGGSLAGIL